MDELSSTRIVLMGKTGSGKSSLANMIFGEDVFKINHSPVSETGRSRAETKLVNGRNLTLIDSPSVFNTCVSEALLKAEIVRCIAESAPGPHVFLIVLQVEKFTEQEKAVIKKICQYFSEDALKFAAVVFTHGDQLPDGMRIEEFVSLNQSLSDLVKKCGNRCHVTDNKYWNATGNDPYRNNQFQVAELLKTTDKIIEANGRRCYTNEILQEVRREIQMEEELLQQSSSNMTPEELRNQAKSNVVNELMVRLVGTATGALFGAFLGVLENISAILQIFQRSSSTSSQERDLVLQEALNRGLRGGMAGFNAAAGAKTAGEAFQKAKTAVLNDPE
ncbi:GTPase IMAP family member 7-like [Nematolebias whitei]|uniref:GTPase IMAP family member 7-like n=1 Tax=Nematolebias whitei TaxID=451745 RepID=UPI0018977D54|nr:GTPase IMAP family member 7-like [Nematolebias whitei]